MQRAYAHHVPRIGLRPAPMDADYDALVAAGVVTVAEVDGAPGGLIVLGRRPDHLVIENVAVDPALQGRGVGRALLTFAEARAAELGLAEVRLFTHVKMTENQAIYARLGYRETERRAERGFARVFMSKRIAE